MTSSTANLTIGAAKVSWGGTDLGWTSGGVTVSIEESATELTLDQFAKTVMNEIITGKKIVIKVALTEVGVIAIMPYIFSNMTVSTNAVYIAPDVGISRLGKAAALTIELNATETTQEGANYPNKFYFYKAVPCGPLNRTYDDWSKQVAHEVEFHVYPDSANSYKLGYRGSV